MGLSFESAGVRNTVITAILQLFMVVPTCAHRFVTRWTPPKHPYVQSIQEMRACAESGPTGHLNLPQSVR